MLPYFPFEQDSYAMTLGVRALRPDETLIEVDEAHYARELALKAANLAANPRARFQALPGTEPHQWETVTVLLPLMARQNPQHFALEVEGERWRWRNLLLGTETRFTPGDAASLPHAPLDWLGRQVQEDLLLMDGTREGLPMMAGQLCFPSMWCLDEKMGRSMLDIHTPVPGFVSKLGTATTRLMEGLKPGRTVTRCNWALTVSDRMDLEPWTLPEWKHLFEGITRENAGERCFLRLERQTLSLMPNTGAILFTIHTYRAPVATEVEDPARRRRLANVLRTVPADTATYKRISSFLEPLVAWLDSEPVPQAANS
ncbi:heme-dependent oxidative N-demethylase family protein [Archangium lansingense]|uniref:heme-dependent oxidative N-demethylase family protein n=1 Tax=Archangium lansingense TaxID=2995310 RepID=UPI003B819927